MTTEPLILIIIFLTEVNDRGGLGEGLLENVPQDAPGNWLPYASARSSLTLTWGGTSSSTRRSMSVYDADGGPVIVVSVVAGLVEVCRIDIEPVGALGLTMAKVGFFTSTAVISPV